MKNIQLPKHVNFENEQFAHNKSISLILSEMTLSIVALLPISTEFRGDDGSTVKFGGFMG
jgi:hypothetical protein